MHSCLVEVLVSECVWWHWVGPGTHQWITRATRDQRVVVVVFHGMVVVVVVVV